LEGQGDSIAIVEKYVDQKGYLTDLRREIDYSSASSSLAGSRWRVAATRAEFRVALGGKPHPV